MPRTPPPLPMDAETLVDLLGLVGEVVPLGVVVGWSPVERRQVERWAGARHLAASDNDITVPNRPACLEGWGAGLLPCPFDGGEAVLEVEGEPGRENWWVRCLTCGAIGPLIVIGSDAAAAWNQRATSTEGAATATASAAADASSWTQLKEHIIQERAQ